MATAELTFIQDHGPVIHDVLRRLCGSFGQILDYKPSAHNTRVRFATVGQAADAHERVAAVYTAATGFEMRSRPLRETSSKSYCAPTLRDAEAEGYAAGALLLWATIKGQPCVLLTLEKRKNKLGLNTLGGKREGGEFEVHVTAAREAWEEAAMATMHDEQLSAGNWPEKAAAAIQASIEVPARRFQEFSPSSCCLWLGMSKMGVVIRPAETVLASHALTMALPGMLQAARQEMLASRVPGSPAPVGKISPRKAPSETVGADEITTRLADLTLSPQHKNPRPKSPVRFGVEHDSTLSLHWVPVAELLAAQATLPRGRGKAKGFGSPATPATPEGQVGNSGSAAGAGATPVTVNGQPSTGTAAAGPIPAAGAAAVPSSPTEGPTTPVRSQSRADVSGLAPVTPVSPAPAESVNIKDSEGMSVPLSDFCCDVIRDPAWCAWATAQLAEQGRGTVSQDARDHQGGGPAHGHGDSSSGPGAHGPPGGAVDRHGGRGRGRGRGGQGGGRGGAQHHGGPPGHGAAAGQRPSAASGPDPSSSRAHASAGHPATEGPAMPQPAQPAGSAYVPPHRRGQAAAQQRPGQESRSGAETAVVSGTGSSGTTRPQTASSASAAPGATTVQRGLVPFQARGGGPGGRGGGPLRSEAREWQPGQR